VTTTTPDLSPSSAGAPGEDQPIRLRETPTVADRSFRFICTAAALVSLAIVLLTLFFLFDRARPAFRSSGVLYFLTHSVWGVDGTKFGVLGLLENTALIALIALFVGAPMGIGMALFINEYASPRLRRPITSTIDLLAALPSLLFGIWGFFAFRTHEVRVANWFAHNLSVIPIFRVGPHDKALVASSFEAGLVVALMIVPITTSVVRDVMAQVPRELCEGALALGGTRWGMIRTVILPFSKNGIAGAVLLGFGRAFGETIAIALLIGGVIFHGNSHVLTQGTGSIAAWIALDFGQATPVGLSALIAAGLVLFLITLFVNLIGRTIVSRAGRVK
jgi:phosphate transport system permease protein